MSTSGHLPPAEPERPDAGVRDVAALWAVRHDRGLTPSERAAFARWLKEDARHREAWERSVGVWKRFEGMEGLRRAPVPAARPARWLAWGGLAAAAAIGWLLFSPPMSRDGETSAAMAGAEPRTVVLPDGTRARLNAGAVLVEEYSAAERTVRLARGEAYFVVEKNPARPFVVRAGGVRVRAVGTAFEVMMDSASVGIMVTEGTVELVTPDHDGSPAGGAGKPEAPWITAGYRAVVETAVAGGAPAVSISAVDLGKMAGDDSWRGDLLHLGGSTLADLAVVFQQETGRKLLLTDPSLESLRIGGRYPRNDLDGFVRVLEEHYDIRARRMDDGVILLEPKP